VNHYKRGNIDKLATEAETVLIKSGIPAFQQGNRLVRPYRKELPASHGRATVAAGLTEIEHAGRLSAA
jgi:hypothetical protein